jgi:hypothetical protein
MPGAEDLREGPPLAAVFADIDDRVKELAVIDFYLSPLFREKVDNFFPLFLGVCCASRIKSPKIALQAIFYLTNSQRSPDNRDFCGIGGAKIHKCNRLLG